jgi:hypothetical protein
MVVSESGWWYQFGRPARPPAGLSQVETDRAALGRVNLHAKMNLSHRFVDSPKRANGVRGAAGQDIWARIAPSWIQSRLHRVCALDWPDSCKLEPAAGKHFGAASCGTRRVSTADLGGRRAPRSAPRTNSPTPLGRPPAPAQPAAPRGSLGNRQQAVAVAATAVVVLGGGICAYVTMKLSAQFRAQTLTLAIMTGGRPNSGERHHQVQVAGGWRSPAPGRRLSFRLGPL